MLSRFTLSPFLYFYFTTLAFLHFSSGHEIEPHHIIGIILTLTGEILWITARIEIGQYFSLYPKAEKLITSGIYRHFLHPVYYFSSLALFGLAVFLNNGYLFLLVTLLFLTYLYCAREEEKVMTDKFKGRYLKHKQQVLFWFGKIDSQKPNFFQEIWEEQPT